MSLASAWSDARRKASLDENGIACYGSLWMALLKKERDLSIPSSLLTSRCVLWSTGWRQEEQGRPTALCAFSFWCTWCVVGAWTPDLSGVFSSASNWLSSSVLSPLWKGFLDLFVLAVALACTSESSISWIPRSPRRPSNTDSSSSHFRAGVGRELPLALKISLSNNFHINYIYYPSLLLPELAKPVFNPDNFKMFRFSHPALTACLVSSSAWLRWWVKSKHTSWLHRAPVWKYLLHVRKKFRSVINEMNPWSQRNTFTCDCWLLQVMSTMVMLWSQCGRQHT